MMRMLPRAILALTVMLWPLLAHADTKVYVAHGGGNVGEAHGGEIGVIDLVTGAYTPLTGSLGSVTSLVSNGTTLYTYETQTRMIIQIDPISGAILSQV